MSGGPKRNADKINTIGIVMIGICGAVLVYVSITALQAFYANDVADVQTMADYGGQDVSAKDLKAAQLGAITSVGRTGKGSDGSQLYQIKIEDGMAAVLRTVNGDKATGVAADPANLVPSVGPQKTATIQPLYGRPKPLPTTPAAGAAPAPADGAGAGSGSGSAAAAGGAPAEGLGATAGTVPTAPTGTTTDQPLKKDADKTEAGKKAEQTKADAKKGGDKGDAKKGDKK